MKGTDMKPERVWHSGPPPAVGWWNASRSKDPYIWRWWDGKKWSWGVDDYLSSEYAARKAKVEAGFDCVDHIFWTDYWPRPGYSRSTGEKLPEPEMVYATEMPIAGATETRKFFDAKAAAIKARETAPAPKPTLDDYHAHEALDRTSVLLDNFSTHLLDHPYVTEDLDLHHRAKKVMKHLSALYQEIGERHL